MMPVRMSQNKEPMMFSSIGTLCPYQRGIITGLETAIVLIAFVVVSSVYAFAAQSTGLFSSDKAKETHAAGGPEARGTLELKGSVVVKASGTTGAKGVVTSMEFQISNAAAGEPSDLTPGNTVIKYSDNAQTVAMNSSTEFSASNIAAFAHSDSLLETDEVFQITLLDMTTQLATDLGTNKDFTRELVPHRGSVLDVS